MVINYRKLWTALGIACLSTNLAAVSTSNNTSSSSSQMNSTDQNMMASGLIYAGPQLGEDSKGISLGADYILWQVVQEGLEVVHSNYTLTSASPMPTSPTLGSTGYPKFNLLSGFKVHAGVTLADCEDVDLFLQYIWLQRTTGTNSGTGGATTYYAYDSDYDSISSWSSSFKTSYNVLDLEMGRLASYAKDTISIRNFWGIRGVWNTHNFNNLILTALANLGPVDLPLTYNSYQNTSGAGVRAGTNIAWQLFANKKYFDSLKIIGMSAISGVYGRTYVDTLVSFAVYGVDYYSICNRDGYTSFCL